MTVGKHVLYPEESKRIIECFYHVYDVLGYGFLEKVYENSLAIELRRKGFKVQQQARILVKYRNAIVGEYFADMLVDDKIILELKAGTKIIDQHLIQVQNYLKATNIELGIILNFGPRPEYKRRVYTQQRK